MKKFKSILKKLFFKEIKSIDCVDESARYKIKNSVHINISNSWIRILIL